MEVLFELISNPIALFILIGVISSIFNKAKGNVQEQKRRPVRPSIPPADTSVPVERQRDHRRDTRRDSERSKPAQHKPTIADREPGALSEIQKVYQERKRQAERPASAQRNADRVSRLSTGDTAGRLRQERKHTEPELNFQPDRDRLVEGLIWAEVLGQPRAKKPYNPSQRN
jgi:hypothetical protein